MVIVLDTGSTDRTVDICKKFNKGLKPLAQSKEIKILEFSNENDYSKIKNEVYKSASGDWILSLGPNELLTEECKKNLLPFLLEQPYQNNPIVFCLKYLESFTEFIFSVSSFKDSLFKNNFEIISVRPVAEHLFKADGQMQVLNIPFLNVDKKVISANKANENILLINDAIKKEGDLPDNYYYYLHLGDLYFSIKEYAQALNSFIISYELFNKTSLPKENSFYCNILIKIIRQLIVIHQDYQKSLPFIEEILNISPTFQDALFFAGYCNRKSGDLKNAVEIYEYLYDQIFSGNTNPLEINSLEDNITLWLNLELGRCYNQLNDQAKTVIYLHQAHSISTGYKPVLKELIMFYLEQNHLEQALEYYFDFKETYTLEDRKNLSQIAKLPAREEYKKTIDILMKEIISVKKDF